MGSRAQPCSAPVPAALFVHCSRGRDNGTDPKPAPKQSQVFPLSSVGFGPGPKLISSFPPRVPALMSVTGNKGRDKSSIGCFRCQAHSLSVCVCVTGVDINSHSLPGLLLNCMTACKGQAATGLLLPAPTSKDFSLKRAGMFCAVPKETFLGRSCLGTRKELGWLPGQAGTAW